MTRLGLPLAFVVAVLATVGCTVGGVRSSDPEPPVRPSTSSPATTPPEATPPPRVPKAGACYRLDYAEAVSPTSSKRPVPCRARHTSRTAYVGELDAVVDGHLLAVDSAHVQARVAQSCRTRVARYLGGTEEDLRLTMLRPVWFSPSLAQSDRGASWFRCDVIALGQPDTLTPLGRVEGALSSGGDRYAVCGTTAPDEPGFTRVVCSAKHRWRAIGSYQVGGQAYPGPEAFHREGSTTCKQAAKSRAEDALDYEWALDWPSREQWKAGRHWGLCWAPER